MSKSTITEQIEVLEAENKHLKNLERILDKFIQIEFGTSSKNIHKIIKNYSKEKLDFAEKIADFYNLQTEEDYEDFLKTFCTNEFINYYNSTENPESND